MKKQQRKLKKVLTNIDEQSCKSTIFETLKQFIRVVNTLES